MVKYQWKGDNFAMNKREDYFFPSYVEEEKEVESREESGRLERARESDKVGEGHGCSTEVNTLTFSVLWEVICIFAFVIYDPVIQFLLQDFHENH